MTGRTDGALPAHGVLVLDEVSWWVSDFYLTAEQAEREAAKLRRKNPEWTVDVVLRDTPQECRDEADRRTCKVFGTEPAWE